MKRVFIIHGWDGSPEGGWFPWLKRELESRGFEVHVPAMPEPDVPKIEPWVARVAEVVGEPDGQTFFVGHSVGCQAVLRYLETIGVGLKIGGMVLVAPWMRLDQETIKEEGEEVIEIARPWMEAPIDFQKIKLHQGKTIAIFSDNDPYVPIDQMELFKNELNAEVIIERGQGHFSSGDGVTELPSALDAILKMLD